MTRRLDAVAWALLAVAWPVLTLVKINPVDVPWHLATARLAAQTGRWPVENTFSFTYPDYPIFQQYPAFQALLYAFFRAGGWPALTVLLSSLWLVVVLAFLRWAGPLRSARPFHVAWAVLLFTLQSRMSLRPDVASLALLGAELLVIEAYRCRDRRWIVLLPLVHWLWVNTHQLFVLSFAVQGLLLAHLAVVRWRPRFVDGSDARLPLWPVAAAFAASAAVSFLGPLGAKVVQVFPHTAGSLSHHRDHVQEFARLWTEPVWTAVALLFATAVLAVAWRARRSLNPFELGLWAMSAVLAISAIRGLVFFALVSTAVLQRHLLRHPPQPALTPFLQRYLRGLAFAFTALGVVAIAKHRHVPPANLIGGAQPGLGRSEGDWTDAALAHLRADPPPGRMMNVPWVLANTIIWGWPEQKVFVDPRFESYPRAFLLEAIASYRDDGVLQGLIDRHDIGWVFSEHCRPHYRDRIRYLTARGWTVTYADARTAVLVRPGEATAAHRARHAFSPASAPPDLVAQPARRRARQRICWAQLLATLGAREQAAAQLATAAVEADGDQEILTDVGAARAP